jgi:hypothetical protein
LEHWLVFVIPFAGYLLLGILMTVRWHAYFLDAVSREANGFYVLYSNDPHLAAIGFVWNPLTSISVMPLLLLHGVIPALTKEDLAATMMSAVFMAGACWQVFRFFEDLSLARWTRWALVACFALNPMIIVYGANGMSEALFNFTLAATVRHLCRWMRDDSTRALVIAGIWLGIAYAVRNEVAAAALAATLLVGGVVLKQASGPVRQRRYAALTDMVIFALPFAVSFVGWAAVSWIIVGHPFEQISSTYGTASQLKLLNANSSTYGSYGAPGLPHLRYTTIAMLTYAPLIPFLLSYAGYRAWKTRQIAILAVVAVVGAVCLFEVAAFTAGQVAWFYRYDIYMVLFSVMVAGCAAATRVGLAPNAFRSIRLVAGRRSWHLTNGLAPLVALLLLLPGIFVTGYTMLYSSMNSTDISVFRPILWPHSKSSLADGLRYQWSAVRALDARLDALHAPDGSIMLDDFELCMPMLILGSDRPRQFAIPNDESFNDRLGAPYQKGVRYMLVGQPVGYGKVDALNVAFPDLYDTGQGDTGQSIGTRLATVQLPECGSFRLYKLNPESA